MYPMHWTIFWLGVKKEELTFHIFLDLGSYILEKLCKN